MADQEQPPSGPTTSSAESAPLVEQQDAPPSMTSFSEESVRKAFVRQVYAILVVQLVVSAAIVSLFVLVDSIKEFVQDFPWVIAIFAGATLVLAIVLTCFDQIRRRWPTNLILLFLYTVFQSCTIGVVAAYTNTDALLIAVGSTAVVVLALTLFAMQTKLDFTYLNGILFVLLVTLVLFGIFCAIFRSRIITMIYASLGVLLFSVYLVVDTQMMLGGKHKYALSPEEYIFAALSLYVDIINIFIYILTLVTGASN